MRHAVRLSGLDGLAITKLDVLAGLDPLRICVAYRSGESTIDHVPAGARALARAVPVYEDWPGFGNLSRIGRFEDLPSNARRYLDRITELSGAPVRIVSVGASREDTIVVTDPFS